MPPKRGNENKQCVNSESSEDEFQIEDDYGSLPASPQLIDVEVSVQE